MHISKIDNTSFGIGIRTEFRTIPNTVGYMTINKIQLRDRTHIVYHNNYLHGKIMDKLVQVYNSMGELINCKYKTFKRK